MLVAECAARRALPRRAGPRSGPGSGRRRGSCRKVVLAAAVGCAALPALPDCPRSSPAPRRGARPPTALAILLRSRACRRPRGRRSRRCAPDDRRVHQVRDPRRLPLARDRGALAATRYSARLHALYSWFVDEVEARRPALVVDVGCGDAALTDLMARATPGRVVGIEPEPSGVEFARDGARRRPVPGRGGAGPRARSCRSRPGRSTSSRCARSSSTSRTSSRSAARRRACWRPAARCSCRRRSGSGRSCAASTSASTAGPSSPRCSGGSSAGAGAGERARAPPGPLRGQPPGHADRREPHQPGGA